MPATGETWNQFKLLEPLGKGGMGEVFLADDTSLHRKVAVKFLPKLLEEDPTARERFLREARSAAALDHPYICKIYEIGEVDGKAFIAMEYVEGVTLQEKLAPGPLRLPQLLELGAEIAEAVEAAHKKLIVHRDLKTPNIMVTPDGHVKVLDFGLAKKLVIDALSESHVDTLSGRLTAQDSTPGTVIYMSPEQVRGERIDSRADIFSLGVVLYEMATGKVPFQGATSGLTYDAILNRGPALPQSLNPNLPQDLEHIILKALEKDRNHRYQNAKALMVDLRRLKRDTDTAQAPMREPYAAVSTEPKRKNVWGVVAGAVAILIAVGIVLFQPSSDRSSETITSLAVLPLENTRNDPEVDYLSDGIAESLINRLSQIPQLQVMARSTAFRYRGQGVDPQTVGRELNVGAVLTGRLVQQGDSLNVQAELVDVASGTQLWGEQYSRKLADIVAVQNELAQEISQALRLQLTGEEQKQLAEQGTANSEAFQAYLKGRYLLYKRTNEDFKRAIESYEEAKENDPEYALAYVGLADCYLLLGAQFYGADPDFPPSVAMAKARTSAREALRLNPTLTEAYVTMAYIEFLHDWNWEAAERDFLKAIELKPSYATAHQWYSEYLMVMGRHDEAIEEGTRAVELEPASPLQTRELAHKFLRAGRYPEAIEQLQKTLELDASYSLTRSFLISAYWQEGMRDEAIAEANRIDQRQGRFYQLLAQGKNTEAIALADSFPREEFTTSNLTTFYAHAGDKEKTLELLEEAFRQRDANLPLTLATRELDPWRSEPRFIEIQRSMGLEP